jgi:hypothetical protein
MQHMYHQIADSVAQWVQVSVIKRESLISADCGDRLSATGG